MSPGLIEYFKAFITERRFQHFQEVLQQRTRYITVVLEDIFQPHNASAVLRSCDCFGIQDVHIIENKNRYSINPDVALGANKWLNLHQYNKKDENSRETIRILKNQGYRIVATTPNAKSTMLQNFNLHEGKSAFFFGTELKGLTDIVMDSADELLQIPMYGFTESFNISVSVAVVLYCLSASLRESDIHWQLSATEKEEILLQWLRSSIKKADLLEKDYQKKISEE